MTHPRALAPILEFDPDRTAIFEPSSTGASGRSRRIAGRVVLCFFQDVTEAAVQELGGVPIGRPDRAAVVGDRAQPHSGRWMSAASPWPWSIRALAHPWPRASWRS